MEILVTNDDGIYAPGLQALVREIKRIARVTVVAPESEQSSVSHGITLFQPLWSKRLKINGKFFGYAISGTPADCVKFGVRMILKHKPDFVISGINPGANDGCSVFYSGTVAGAREGAFLGIPSFAISSASFHQPDYQYAAGIASKVIRFLQKNPLPRQTFLNVNIPDLAASRIKGFRFCRQGTSPIHTRFQRKYNPFDKEYFWMSGKGPDTQKDPASDTAALGQGYVTLTPIQCDLTDERVLKQLPKNWKW